MKQRKGQRKSQDSLDRFLDIVEKRDRVLDSALPEKMVYLEEMSDNKPIRQMNPDELEECVYDKSYSDNRLIALFSAHAIFLDNESFAEAFRAFRICRPSAFSRFCEEWRGECDKFLDSEQ